VHFVNANLPFGGVGFSGSGRYHGEAGFETFSNKKALMRFNFWLDNPMVYPPYKKWQFNLAKWFLKHLS
jgi:aldehyde dehydrogenase (NAD+)